MVLQEANRYEEKIFNEFWLDKVSETDVVSSKPMHSWGAQLENYEGPSNEIEKYANEPCISLFGTMVDLGIKKIYSKNQNRQKKKLNNFKQENI